MQQQEMRRTIPSLQRANDDEFTPDQRSVWAGNLVSCSSLATLGHSRDGNRDEGRKQERS